MVAFTMSALIKCTAQTNKARTNGRRDYTHITLARAPKEPKFTREPTKTQTGSVESRDWSYARPNPETAHAH